MNSFISLPGFPKRCITFFLTLACGVLVLTNATWAAANSAGWVLSYEGKSTNAFIWDKRADGLIKNSVPLKLVGDLLDALGGPPDPVYVVDRRYVSASACMAHACMVKGFFWFDSQSGIGLGAHLSGDSLILGSSRLLPGGLPPTARQAIIAWLSENEIQPRTVQFVSHNGQVTSLIPAQYFPRQKYRARPEGPSFDCKKAATEVETTICDDAMLAKQDLDLAILVDEIRRGHDTVGARDELRSIQREWLKGRDAACKKSPAMAKCLDGQYRQQHDRLMNWLPTR